MAPPRFFSSSRVPAFLLAPLLVGLTTAGLLALQRWISGLEGGANVRPYIIGYLLPIAVVSAVGGRGPGLLASVLSVLCTVLFLITPQNSWTVERPSDWGGLLLLCLTSLLTVAGTHALRQSVRLLAEARLAEARKSAVLEVALDCIITMDHKGRIIEFNPAAEKTFGYRREDVLGRALDETLIPAELRDAHRKGLARYLATGEGPVLNQRIELTALHADGTEFPVELAIAPLHADGSPIFTAYLRDITERRRSEGEVQSLLAQAQARASREALLSQIESGVRESLDPDAIQFAAARSLGEALGADRAYFVLYDTARGVSRIAQDWHRPDLTSLAGEYSLANYPIALETHSTSGPALCLENVDDDAEPLGPQAGAAFAKADIRALIRVLLYDREQVVAALVVGTRQPRAWTPEDAALAEAVAARTRLAVKGARARLREQNIAALLQDALLPDVPDSIPGLTLDKFYKAALEEARIGGDFYDVFALDKGMTALVVGDLSGKGLAAAAQVSTVRNMLRYALYRHSQVSDAVAELNATLATHDLLAGFATLFVGVYDAGTSTLTYVSCGQEPGLVRRADSGQVEEWGPTGPILGADAEGRFEQKTVSLAPGDVFAVFTDGLTEAGPNRVDFLGIPGLTRLLADSSPDDGAEAIVARLVEGAMAHSAGDLRDDVCLLVGIVG